MSIDEHAFDPVQILPLGAFLRTNGIPDYCLTISTDFTFCWRARKHKGRHAEITVGMADGEVKGFVWGVWGEDVYADVRGVSRPLSYGPDFDPTDEDLGGLAVSWAQSLRGRS